VSTPPGDRSRAPALERSSGSPTAWSASRSGSRRRKTWSTTSAGRC